MKGRDHLPLVHKQPLVLVMGAGSLDPRSSLADLNLVFCGEGETCLHCRILSALNLKRRCWITRTDVGVVTLSLAGPCTILRPCGEKLEGFTVAF